jgi:zeaxanthin glucosyltransferase
MVAIPISYDQPAVAARIAYHGVGEVLELGDLTAESLSELIHRVLSDSSYRESAQYFQWIIDETQGLDMAADAIERVLGDTRLLNSPMNRVNGRQCRCLSL